MTSKTLAMIFVVSLSIGGFFLYKSQTNTVFSNLNKAEVQTLLNERKDKDDIALNKFKKYIEKLFEEQEKGTVKRKPICLQGAMKDAYRKGKESVNSAISKVQNLFSDEKVAEKVAEKKESVSEDIELEEVNRLDGFIDEITSVCYQGEIIYLTGKEKAGTITDKDISKFTNDIWNKYFYSSDILEEKIEKNINLFIAEVEDNHKDIYKIINNYDYDFDKSYSTDKEKAMLSLNEFIKKQSGYSIGTTVSAFITGYSLRNLTGSLSSKLGKATKIKGKNWKSAIAGTALSVVAEMWIYNASSDELSNGISKQLERTKKSILYGNGENNGLVQTLKDVLKKYQEDEKKKLFTSLELAK